MGTPPGDQPTAADAAAVAHRQLRRAPGVGSDLRGDVPHPPHRLPTSDFSSSAWMEDGFKDAVAYSDTITLGRRSTNSGCWLA
jgi:hypothetical protein